MPVGARVGALEDGAGVVDAVGAEGDVGANVGDRVGENVPEHDPPPEQVHPTFS